jgi:hypothetical protein
MATGWGACRWRGAPTIRFDRGSIWVSDEPTRLAADDIAAYRVVMGGKHCLKLPPPIGITEHPQPLWPGPAKTLRLFGRGLVDRYGFRSAREYIPDGANQPVRC